jgi:hypothetical protein
MIYDIQENSEEKELIESIFGEVNTLFDSNVNPENIEIIFVPSKKIMNSILGRKTKEWEVASTNNEQGIIMLDRKNYESESCHKYSKEEYEMVLKHEIIHSITFAHYKLYFPDWLIEGLALYFSGQYKLGSKPREFKNFISWDELNEGIYTECGFVIEILFEKYGNDKLFELLRSLRKNESQEIFNKNFERIYGVEFNYDIFNESK